MNSKKSLVAYFSHSGNTKIAAEKIAGLTNSDLFEIKPVKRYPNNYNETVDIAKKEVNSNARPKVENSVEDMDSYDVIYLGYPNWWSTMPMAVFTFLEGYDLSGKKIYPFCTHGGSRMGRSEKDIKDLCPNSLVVKGLPISGSSVNNCDDILKGWIEVN